MDNSRKVDSQKIRALRNKQGWSQEQLATASGLGLRTIQRIEAQGSISTESKVCLAATFDVELSELDHIDIDSKHVEDNAVDKYIPNKMLISIGLASFFFSVIGTIFLSEFNYFIALANLLCLFALIHTAFDWYFSGIQISSSVRRALTAVVVYIICFHAFSAAGNLVFSLLNGILQGVVVGIIYLAFEVSLSSIRDRRIVKGNR